MIEDRIQSNQVHRLVKLLMDKGEASTFEDAVQILTYYRLGIRVSKENVISPASQACLLTMVNTGRRCFLGGVYIYGDLEIPLRIPWQQCTTLSQAISSLQGQVTDELDPTIPNICLTDEVDPSAFGEFSIRPVIRGWASGIVPMSDRMEVSEFETFTPAGVLAGALAVSEAFQYIRGDNPLAGHRSVGLSLWKPEQSSNWLNSDPGPAIESIPSKLWIIGLGHLGQAYLWTLGFLPYERPNMAELVLQDIDNLEDANECTSLLTNQELIGIKKTRAMAKWSEERGFKTTLIERKFAGDFRINDVEPTLALCGVDNADARIALEKVGFNRIIEAGLGKGTQEYLSFQLHTFPASRPADRIWKQENNPGESHEILLQQPAYQELYARGMQRCGLIELAGRSVGASFVGAIASTLVISQVLRMLRGDDFYELLDGDLRSSPILSSAVLNQTKLDIVNPGMIHISHPAS